MLHGGYAIEDLANKSDYLELCYLLLNGELPNASQKADFVSHVTNHTMVHDQFTQFFRGFRRDAHPMAIMTGVVGAMSAFYHDHLDVNSSEDRMVSTIRLVAKIPTLAMAYKYSIGQPFVYPRNDLSLRRQLFIHGFSVCGGLCGQSCSGNARWIRSLSSTRIMSKMHLHRPSASQAPQALTPLPASPQALPPSGASTWRRE